VLHFKRKLTGKKGGIMLEWIEDLWRRLPGRSLEEKEAAARADAAKVVRRQRAKIAHDICRWSRDAECAARDAIRALREAEKAVAADLVRERAEEDRKDVQSGKARSRTTEP